MSAIWCLKSSASGFGYSTVCSGTDQRKHQSSVSLDCVREIHRWSVTGEFPAQRVSNAENVSIWWRLHLLICCGRICICTQHKLTDLFHDRFDLHKAVSCLHNLPHQVHKLTGHIEKYAFIYWRFMSPLSYAICYNIANQLTDDSGKYLVVFCLLYCRCAYSLC